MFIPFNSEYSEFNISLKDFPIKSSYDIFIFMDYIHVFYIIVIKNDEYLFIYMLM